MSEALIVAVCLVGIVLLRALGGLVISLVSTEAQIVVPKSAHAAVLFATRLLPEEHRADYVETWLAELGQLEKRPLKAIWFAVFQCLLSVPSLRRELPAAAEVSEESVQPIPTQMSARGVLTSRQKEVLTLLANGQPTSEVGRSLGLSEATVKSHIKNAMHRLEARNRTELIAQAIRRDLID